MKWTIIILITALVLMSVGCLTFESMETRIRIIEENEPIEVTFIYRDLSSDGADIDKVKEDFEELVDHWTSDEYLIERMEEGYYVKDRAVRFENGKIIGYESGIVKDLTAIASYWTLDGERISSSSLAVPKNKTTIRLEYDNDLELVESNGKVVKLGEDNVIVWPGDTTELYYVLRWIDRDEISEKNRPEMVKMMKTYIAEQKEKRGNQ